MNSMLSCLLKILIFLLLLPLTMAAGTDELEQEREAALLYINQIRNRTGLTPFRKNRYLEISATNHARYLSVNQIADHLQSRNQKEFTGEKPNDRATSVGYASRDVTENFSVGQKNARQSISGLMSAIYHRFAFLDFSKNELGVGIERNPKGLNFVYNMGNDRLDHFCRFAIFLDNGPSYDDVCSHGDKVSAADFDLKRRESGNQNPDMIVWPFDNATDIPTAFYEENPDPLPDYRVSGYPVSAQLNPYLFKKIELQSFKLFHLASEREVTPSRVLTKQLDPNQQFSAVDFALFPLNRLAWNTDYRAEIQLKADGRIVRKSWVFRTVALQHPMFMITGRNENLKMVSKKPYLVHIPPAGRLSYIEGLRWESLSGMKTEVSWQDRNTILIKPAGHICESTHFFLNGDRSFIVQIADRDNLNEQQHYSSGPLSSCLIDAIKDLPGFRITAKGEVIPMKPEQDYWVEITGDNQPVTEVSWQLMNNMGVRVNRLEKNLLKIRLSGTPGQIATFFLSDSGIFKVVLAE